MSDEKPPSPDEATAFLAEAYNLPDEQSMQQFYARWAEEYDNQMINLQYLSPVKIADKLMANLADKDARILDIGCGTGLTVRKLHESGYHNLYGIDLSPDMVRVAGSRGFYQGLCAGDVTEPLPYETGFFHGVISSGTFTHGHVGPEPLAEIARILSSDGILACTVHQDLWQARGFEQRFAELESSGDLTRVSLEKDRYFEDKEKEGWFCVYRRS